MIEGPSIGELLQYQWEPQTVKVNRADYEFPMEIWSMPTKDALASSPAELPPALLAAMSPENFDLNEEENIPELKGLEIDGTLYLWVNQDGNYPRHIEMEYAIEDWNKLHNPHLPPSSGKKTKIQINYYYYPASQTRLTSSPAELHQKVHIDVPLDADQKAAEQAYREFFKPLIPTKSEKKPFVVTYTFKVTTGGKSSS